MSSGGARGTSLRIEDPVKKKGAISSGTAQKTRATLLGVSESAALVLVGGRQPATFHQLVPGDLYDASESIASFQRCGKKLHIFFVGRPFLDLLLVSAL